MANGPASPSRGRVVVMGVAGAGKSTVGRRLAAELGVPFVEGDDYHSAAAIARMRAGLPLDDRWRGPWLDRLHDVLVAHAASGVVLACSALTRAYRRRLVGDLSGVVFVDLVVPRDVLATRLRDRPGHFAGPELLSSQLETLELGDDVITERNTAPIDDVVEQVTRLVRDAVGES